MYGTENLRQVFSDENLVQCWLDYEAALARAEAAIGLIPEDAAAEITRVARVENIDFEKMKAGVDLATPMRVIWPTPCFSNSAARAASFSS